MGHLLKLKYPLETLVFAYFIFNQCPCYTHDGLNAMFSTSWDKTDYSVIYNRHSKLDFWPCSESLGLFRLAFSFYIHIYLTHLAVSSATVYQLVCVVAHLPFSFLLGGTDFQLVEPLTKMWYYIYVTLPSPSGTTNRYRKMSPPFMTSVKMRKWRRRVSRTTTQPSSSGDFWQVLRIQIRISMFLGLLDPDPLVRGTDPDMSPDPFIIKQK
jgi:hypothetical protein